MRETATKTSNHLISWSHCSCIGGCLQTYFVRCNNANNDTQRVSRCFKLAFVPVLVKCSHIVGMPVMLIPAQPDHNDHGAVKLCSLDGRQLGLVPIGQSQLHQFNRPISFGRIIHLEPDVETHRKLYKATVKSFFSLSPPNPSPSLGINLANSAITVLFARLLPIRPAVLQPESKEIAGQWLRVPKADTAGFIDNDIDVSLSGLLSKVFASRKLTRAWEDCLFFMWQLKLVRYKSNLRWSPSRLRLYRMAYLGKCWKR